MRLRLVVGGCALLLLYRAVVAIAAPAHAVAADGSSPRSADPAARLRAAVDADALEIAGVVDRLGDDAVIAALAPNVDVLLQLAAVRGSVYMRSPELALAALTTIASGRDPDLAPAAANRLLQIAQGLALEDLAARELGAVELRALEPALIALASAATARADVRLCAGEAVHLLAQLRAALPTR